MESPLRFALLLLCIVVLAFASSEAKRRSSRRIPYERYFKVADKGTKAKLDDLGREVAMRIHHHFHIIHGHCYDEYNHMVDLEHCLEEPTTTADPTMTESQLYRHVAKQEWGRLLEEIEFIPTKYLHDLHGYSILSHACNGKVSKENKNFIRYLVEDAKLDPFEANKEDITALEIGIYSRNEQCVHTILSHSDSKRSKIAIDEAFHLILEHNWLLGLEQFLEYAGDILENKANQMRMGKWVEQLSKLSCTKDEHFLTKAEVKIKYDSAETSDSDYRSA